MMRLSDVLLAFVGGLILGVVLVASTDSVTVVKDCGDAKCIAFEDKLYVLREVKP